MRSKGKKIFLKNEGGKRPFKNSSLSWGRGHPKFTASIKVKNRTLFRWNLHCTAVDRPKRQGSCPKHEGLNLPAPPPRPHPPPRPILLYLTGLAGRVHLSLIFKRSDRPANAGTSSAAAADTVSHAQTFPDSLTHTHDFHRHRVQSSDRSNITSSGVHRRRRLFVY